MYGWLTNTGVKFVIVVDMEGRPGNPLDNKHSTAIGLRDADLKPVRYSKMMILMYLLCSSILGIQSAADSIYHAAAKSLLQPG